MKCSINRRCINTTPFNFFNDGVLKNVALKLEASLISVFVKSTSTNDIKLENKNSVFLILIFPFADITTSYEVGSSAFLVYQAITLPFLPSETSKLPSTPGGGIVPSSTNLIVAMSCSSIVVPKNQFV